MAHITLRHYFAAQLVTALLGSIALLTFSEYSRAYAIVYIVGEIIVFAAMLPLLHSALTFHPMRGVAVLAGIVAAVFFGCISFAASRGTFASLINTTDGGLLIAFGVPCGMGAAYLRGRPQKIALSLMCMWLALGAFRLGFPMHPHSRAWDVADDFLPTMFVASGCLWLARIDGLQDARS